MPQFRKKPVVIEARQLHQDTNLDEFSKWVNANGGHMAPAPASDSAGSIFVWKIDTLEGPMMVAPGDWIVKGVKGEFYPCKPDIFEMTYDPA